MSVTPVGATCSVAAMIIVGISTNRISMISTGSNLITNIMLDGVNVYSIDGQFNKDINMPKTMTIVPYSYYGNGCNSTSYIIIPPLNTCSTIPQCTLCIDNFNYQRCNGENRYIYDISLAIVIIVSIYLSLWILVPILCLFLAVVKPSGKNGIFRRYMIYAALLSGSQTEAQCDVTGPVADPVPVSSLTDGLQFNLESTSECASFRYIDNSNDFRNIEICYSRFSYESVHQPIYDFATSISTTSSTSIDWTDYPDTRTLYTWVPNGAITNMTQVGDIGTLIVNNNDICCATQQCRTQQMCMDEQSNLIVDGVATMTLPTSSQGITNVLVRSYKEGQNVSLTCMTIVGQGNTVYERDGIKITLSTTNTFSDDSKEYDLSQSTLIYDRFSVLGSRSMYLGDYPSYIMQPYDTECDNSPSRPINRTVMVNSCGDLNTYGLIDNRIIYSRLKNTMLYHLYILLPGSTGARDASYSQLKTEFHEDDDMTRYVNDNYNPMPIGSYPLLAGSTNNIDGVNSRVDVKNLLPSMTLNYDSEDFIYYYSNNLLKWACTKYICIPNNYQAQNNQNCFVGSSGGNYITQTYNIMHILYGGAVKTNIYAECNNRYVRFIDPIEYNACIMELTAMTVCLSPPILYGSLATFSLCLYSVTQVDFNEYAQTLSYAMFSLQDCKNCYTDPNNGQKNFYQMPIIQVDMNVKAVLLQIFNSPCDTGMIGDINYPSGWGMANGAEVVVTSFDTHYDSGGLAATIFSMVYDVFKDTMYQYALGRGLSCVDDVTPPCSFRKLAEAFKNCAANCYSELSFSHSTMAKNPPATSSTNLYFTDDTTAGCGLAPTNIRAETKLKCSFYPEYRWQYTPEGTPSTVGMIPPTIVSSSCQAPKSDGCWASLGIGLGQKDGMVQTLIYSGNLPPTSNAVDDVYAGLTYTYMPDDNVKITQSEFYGSGDYINVPILSVKLESKNVITENSAGYATYLDVKSAYYVSGDVNDDVTFILNANYVAPGVIALTNTQTGSSNMDSQYCYIADGFNCTLYATCTDTPCVVAINAMDTNTSLNTYIIATFNVPEACRDCNQGSQSSQNDVSEVGVGCFLICWNFSGLGGFIGALVEWAIIIFIILIGLMLVCMIPKIYNDIRPKRA